MPGRGAMCIGMPAVRVRLGSTTVSFRPAAQRLQLSREIARGGEASVRYQRIRADDDQVVGAIHVRDCERERIAEQVAARNLFGHLIQGAGGVDAVSPGPGSVCGA